MGADFLFKQKTKNNCITSYAEIAFDMNKNFYVKEMIKLLLAKSVCFYIFSIIFIPFKLIDFL